MLKVPGRVIPPVPDFVKLVALANVTNSLATPEVNTILPSVPKFMLRTLLLLDSSRFAERVNPARSIVP